jgi:hypothetical protein
MCSACSGSRRQAAAVADARNSFWQRARRFQGLIPSIAREFSVKDRRTGAPIDVDTIIINGSMVLLGIDVVKLGGEVNAPGTVPVAA